MIPGTDVLIAGAGPAGAAVALRLAKSGLRVTVVDRARFPREKVCSEYMSPEGVRHLAALGVLAAVEGEAGHPIRGTTVQAPRGSRLTGLFARAGTAPFRATGLSVPRRVLDHVLVTAARRAGATILEGTAVQAVLSEHGAVTGLTVRSDNGTVRDLRARLTVGADGLHSLVARTIGARRFGPLRRFAFVAHVRDVPGLADTAEMHVSADGYVGINPIGGGLANVAVVVPKELAGGARGRVEAFFLEQVERFPGVCGRVKAAGIAREVLVTGPFAAWSGQVVTDGALLTGDAADFFDPFTGEGICAALRGAELVEATVREALAGSASVSARALASYPRARRRAFLGKWAVERAIGYAMLAPGIFDRAVARLERRGLAHTLIGVTGDFVSPRAVLNPVFLSQVVF